jgi:hypothetical protein
MIILIKYGIGCATHDLEIEVDDDAPDDEIEDDVSDQVMQRVDYTWTRAQ